MHIPWCHHSATAWIHHVEERRLLSVMSSISGERPAVSKKVLDPPTRFVTQLEIDVRLCAVMCIREAQKENNLAQTIQLLSLAFTSIYPVLLPKQKVDIEKFNMVDFITLSCT